MSSLSKIYKEKCDVNIFFSLKSTLYVLHKELILKSYSSSLIANSVSKRVSNNIRSSNGLKFKIRNYCV